MNSIRNKRTSKPCPGIPAPLPPAAAPSLILFLFILLQCMSPLTAAPTRSHSSLLFCPGPFDSYFQLDRQSFSILHLSSRGDTLQQMLTPPNSRFGTGNPVDMQFQAPDRLLILDRRDRSILVFSSDLAFISSLPLPPDLQDPAALSISSDNQLLIYDSRHQRIFSLFRSRLSDFHTPDLLYGLNDLGLRLYSLQQLVLAVLPAEQRIFIFNFNGQLIRNLPFPPMHDGSKTLSALPLQQNVLLLHNQLSLSSYDLLSNSSSPMVSTPDTASDPGPIHSILILADSICLIHGPDQRSRLIPKPTFPSR